MKNKLVVLDSIEAPLKPSPGFAKKLLSECKLDICGLCNFGCTYCSSNNGNFLRINRSKFADATEKQLGERVLPADDPSLSFLWHDVIERLEQQLASVRPGFGAGKTLVFSMLTDGFGPELVRRGITERALTLVLSKTSFRIRVLTKSSVVGSKKWIDFFLRHRERFVVGLSVGTLDDAWARKVEIGTSAPSARVRALHRLQDAGVPTFGMACPMFPDLLEADRAEQLIEAIRPSLVEHFWGEPFNDRNNWKSVRAGYAPGSPGFRWLTETYEEGRSELWSAYAADLYERMRDHARKANWLHKLRYLLYEGQVGPADAGRFAGFEGILLQSRPAADGRSANPFIAELQ